MPRRGAEPPARPTRPTLPELVEGMRPAALRQRAAEAYLGLGEDFLDEPCPVPRCDLRKPGSKRPVWVFRVQDLDAFLEGRLVQPGMPSPWAVK